MRVDIAKAKFGLKPTLRIVHVVTMCSGNVSTARHSACLGLRHWSQIKEVGEEPKPDVGEAAFSSVPWMSISRRSCRLLSEIAFSDLFEPERQSKMGPYARTSPRNSCGAQTG